MARFLMGACAMASRISANAFMIVCLLMILLWLSNSVAQPLGRGDPYVAALKVDAKNIVVGRRSSHSHRRYLALRVAHRHLRLAILERRTINGPVHAVVVSQPLVGAEPGAIAVHALDRVDEVGRKPAVFGEEVVPVAAVVAAGPEVSRRPYNVFDITHRSNDLVDQALVLEEHNLVFAVRIFVLVPAPGFLGVFKK